MKKGWDLTQEKFDQLLAWLSPGDRDGGGGKYEAIRERLVVIFTCRGCPEAEDLADETINRVVNKLPGLAETYVGNPALYFYGVAQKVYLEWLEWLRKKGPLPLPPDPPQPVRRDEDDEDERLAMQCMEHCIQELPAGSRELIVGYYLPDREAEKDYRKRLAQKLKISSNALRIRAHRVKAVLQVCVEDCVGRAGAGEK